MRLKTMCALAVAVTVAVLAVISAPVSANETDDRIASAFKNSYVYKTYLNDEQIEISVEDGDVMLSGDVSTIAHKSLAQDTAEALPGVKSVTNHIETAEQSPDGNSDAWIGMKVKLALLFHRHVSGTSTTVNVDDGIVTLTGEVTNQAKKELTSEYAKDIDGVKSVNNKMTVAAVLEPEKRTENEKIDDASVSAQVRTALSIHRSTSNVRTKVEARDGEVTLTGIAKNEAEKSLVTKVVSDVRGVSSVNNMMTIDQVKTK